MTPPTALEGSALAVEAPADNDDIFGPSRSFPPKSNKPKPSMISAKLRAKEERKKVIQICTEKLEKIKDPDRNLRRSVCINNTYFKLQDEVRREKQMKHMSSANRFDVDEEESRYRNRRGVPNAEQKQRMLDKALESIDKELSAIDANMPSLEHEMLPDELGIVNSSLNPLRTNNDDVLDSFVSSQSCMSVTPALISHELSLEMAFGERTSANNYSVNSDKNLEYSFCKTDSNSLGSRCRSRKRSFDEVEDCDVHDVLSQFYMPPTPRLITSIDDDVLLNVVDDDPVELVHIKHPATETTVESVGHADESSPCKKMKVEEKHDFENGFDKMLELDTDLNQNKSGFQTLNELSGEPIAKRVKFSPATDYDVPLDARDLNAENVKPNFQENPLTAKPEECEKFHHRRSSKSEFEIILDALRLDDGKDICDREDLMYFCNKSEKLVVSENGDIRSRYLDSCGQAAILGDQQAAGFHGLLASLET